MSTCHKGTQKGFTLLEIIFALAIIVVGMVGVLALFPAGLHASKRSGDFTVVSILAQERVEQIKIEQDYYTDQTNAPFEGFDGSPWSYPSFPVVPEEYLIANLLPSDAPGYFWSAVISRAPLWDLSAPGVPRFENNLCQVNVSIYFLDKGKLREENFVTYLVNYQ